jgi:hypothetical protein
MKRSSGSRKKVNLSESIQQQLNAYAIAAGAAGVSVLALAQPSEAKIVYTPTHVVLGAGQPPFPIDLNHDGTIDFYLLHSFSHFGGRHAFAACQLPKTYHGSFCFNSNSSNVIRASAGRSYAAALRYGAKIQHGDRFITFGHPILGTVCCYGTGTPMWRGPWVDGGKGVKNRYLGMKFKIKGRFHFGWARITITTTLHDFTATLTGYAYETIPGKSIVAGQTKGPDDIVEGPGAALTAPTRKPATLGALAMGAPGLSIWRREESAVSALRQTLRAEGS